MSVAVSQITKQFGGTIAVDDVTMSIAPGEIVGLVGENGAGKTTLMRIVAGELHADSGSIQRSHRIGIVHQHFAIVPELTIAENLALLDRRRFRFLSKRSIESDAQRTITQSGIALPDVSRRAGELAIGERAKLELIKALAVDPELLILDEPTSVLTPVEAAELFAVVRRLARSGTAVVFISHKVREVLEIATRVVVMRRGRIVGDRSVADWTQDGVAEAMVGEREVAMNSSGGRIAPAEAGGTMLLRVDHVSGEIIRDASLHVRKQQVVAVVGVAGNGQSELAEMLRGIRRPVAGHLEFATRRVAFIPEDRTRDGIVPQMTIAENISLGGRRWSPRDATTRATRLIDAYTVRATGPSQRAGSLSGGNQQKVILARELDREPELIIASEPTRGLDIEASRFVHEQLRNAVEAGAGVLMITSDLDEAFSLADLVYVIYRGKLSAALTPGEAAADIGPLMAGIR